MKRSAWTAKRLKSIRESLWFVPLVIAAAGVAGGLILPALDVWLFGSDGAAQGTLLEGVVPDPNAADSFVSTAMAGLATILGVAFSLTVVTLQLAATQYTSRLLRRFMADPFTRAVLGFYLATIVYLAVILRTIEQPGPGSAGFVPELSLLLAIVLFIACIVMLAVFIHHLSRSIQSGPIVAGVGKDTIGVIRKCSPGRSIPGSPPVPDDAPCVVTTRIPGYLQLVDEEELLDAAPEFATAMRIEVHAGQFLLPGRPLVSMWPHGALDDTCTARIREAFAMGAERTTHQDALYGVRQLVDMGLKALSPAINDVHTAVMVVNELGAVCDQLISVADVPTRRWREIRRGRLTLYMPQLDLKTLLDHAFDEMPRAGVEHPVVIARLLEVLAELAQKAPDARTRAVILGAGLRVSEYVERGDFVPAELQLLRKMQHALSTSRIDLDVNLTNPV